MNILNTFTKARVDGHIEIVKILLANGADPKIKNKEGLTAIGE